MLTAEETSRLQEEDLALQQAAQNATNTQNAWQDNYQSNFG
jgi:FtsZ-binding cell division protein ZapB